MRRAFATLGLMLGIWLLPSLSEAVIVDCNKNQKITPKVKEKAVITIKGHCTENVLISASDVTISADGGVPASITPADPSQPTISLNGAMRVTIDGMVANGFTVNAGLHGIAASRGSTLTLKNCAVTGTTLTGVLSAYGSTVAVDACHITGNSGNGVVASNNASAVVTNSTVSENTGSGLIAVRGAYLRVGQDLDGTATVKPVTVSGNHGNGITITESASGTIVGGVVEDNEGSNIAVTRASSGQIGVGSNGLTGGVLVRNADQHGILVEGGSNAGVVFGEVKGNGLVGIMVTNAASARIGILGASYAPITVSDNGTSGIQVSIGASAHVGGATIAGNGTVPSELGFGLGVHQATAVLVGNNAIQNNAASGVFVRAGSVYVGDEAFGLPTTNTISGNGAIGPNTGGLFAFQNGVIFVNDATVSNNTGPALQAFEAGVIELRKATSVTAKESGTTPGATILFGSVLRIRETASIKSSTGDGVQASNLSAVNVRDNSAVIQGNGATGVGIRCTITTPIDSSAALLSGSLGGVSGTLGPQMGCNDFPTVP